MYRSHEHDFTRARGKNQGRYAESRRRKPHLRRRAFFSEEKMCQECYAATCPPACPYRREDDRRTLCACCGEPIFEDGSGYYANGERAICATCADEITLEELIEIARLSDTDELLSLLGFRYRA